jgi:hypothetical protein
MGTTVVEFSMKELARRIGLSLVGIPDDPNDRAAQSYYDRLEEVEQRYLLAAATAAINYIVAQQQSAGLNVSRLTLCGNS